VNKAFLAACALAFATLLPAKAGLFDDDEAAYAKNRRAELVYRR